MTREVWTCRGPHAYEESEATLQFKPVYTIELELPSDGGATSLGRLAADYYGRRGRHQACRVCGKRTLHAVDKETIKLPWVMVFTIPRFASRTEEDGKTTAFRRKNLVKYPRSWDGQDTFSDNPKQKTRYRLLGVVANRGEQLAGSQYVSLVQRPNGEVVEYNSALEEPTVSAESKSLLKELRTAEMLFYVDETYLDEKYEVDSDNLSEDGDGKPEDEGPADPDEEEAMAEIDAMLREEFEEEERELAKSKSKAPPKKEIKLISKQPKKEKDDWALEVNHAMSWKVETEENPWPSSLIEEDERSQPEGKEEEARGDSSESRTISNGSDEQIDSSSR